MYFNNIFMNQTFKLSLWDLLLFMVNLFKISTSEDPCISSSTTIYSLGDLAAEKLSFSFIKGTTI